METDEGSLNIVQKSKSKPEMELEDTNVHAAQAGEHILRINLLNKKDQQKLEAVKEAAEKEKNVVSDPIVV